MINFETEDDIINFLEGKWESMDKSISFELVGTGIIDIIGVNGFSNTPITKSRYSLKNDPTRGWLITNSIVLKTDTTGYPILFIENHRFAIGNWQYPPQIIIEYNRVF